MTCTKRSLRRFVGLTVAAAAVSICQSSNAASFLWNGANGVSTTTNWSDTANWNPTGAPGSADTAIFGTGGTVGDALTVNNVVDTSATISVLNYTNATSGAWHVTQISAPNKLTVSADATALTNFVVGGLNADGSTTSVGMIGDGTLEVDGSSTNTFKVGNAASANVSINATLDMSGLSNFVYNAPSGTWIIAGSGGDARAGGVLNLAGASNNVTVNTINFNTGSGNNSPFHSLIQFGSGTNIFNVGTFVVCQTKAQFADVQFLSTAPATAGLRIRGVNGNSDDTSRANITIGDRNSTGTANTIGRMLLNGHPVDIKANTIIIGQDRSGANSAVHGGLGTLQFDTGVVDANSIVMGNCTTADTTTPTAIGALTVGAGGKLIVGSGGISLANQVHGVAAGVLSISGSVISSNSIVKQLNAGNGTNGIINITGGNLTLTTGTIGTTLIPVDQLNISSAALTLPVVNNSTTIVVQSYNPGDDANVINISSVPVVSGYPTQLPVISYTTLAGGGSASIGTLPGTFKGYITNDTTQSTVFLVLTNGPATSKMDTWTGSANQTWDTSSLNWTSASAPAIYAESDSVIFDDSSTQTNINISAAHTPLSMTFSNASEAYILAGAGKISGSTSLTNAGSGSVTLATTGGDDFSGGIAVGSGTVILDNANSAITGPLAITSGATFRLGNNDANGNLLSSITNDGTLIFNRSDNLAINFAIGGFGSLVKTGNGILTLSNAYAGFGDTTVSNGTLALAGNGSITNSGNVNVTGATLDLSAVNSGSTTMNSLNLDGATLTLGTTNLVAPLNASAVSMFGAPSTINVTALPTIATYPATITLVKTFAGIFGFNATLGSLPAATPPFAGSLSVSSDQLKIQLVLTSGPTGTRPYVAWSGADLPNLNTNWSDAQNWQVPGAPNPGENVVFNSDGAQTSSALLTPGGGLANFDPEFINNIVDGNFTLSSLVFTNISGAFHNTFIKSGDILSITNNLNIGAFDTGTSPQITSVSISGTNATLSYDNTNGNVQIWNGNSSSSSINNQARLDLSALDTFNAASSRLLVGANINQAVNRASGILYLAKTNNLTAEFQTTSSDAGSGTGNAAITVGDANSNAGADAYLYLGIANNISADTINVGRQKANAHLVFNPLWANTAPYPTATFQGFSGGRVALFEVGNGAGNTGTATLSADATLTGGFVNASIDVLNVGRGSSGGSGSGTVTGRLTFDAGTINANTVNIGLQPVTGSKVGVGILGVSSNTIIGAGANLVVGTINLGLVGGGVGAANTSGSLNITNGTVTANAIVAGTNSVSTINIIGGRLNVATTIGSSSAPLGTLNLSSMNTPDNSNTVVQLSAALTPNVVVANLNIDGLDATTNRINISSVAPVTAPAELPLIQYVALNQTAGSTFNLGLGTLPPGYVGYLTNDTTLSAIALVVTTVAPPVTTPPTIGKVTISGGNVVLTGTNNVGAGGTFHVLSSTNLAAPLSTWTILTNGSFDGSGNFSQSIPLDSTLGRSFYLLQVP